MTPRKINRRKVLQIVGGAAAVAAGAVLLPQNLQAVVQPESTLLDQSLEL